MAEQAAGGIARDGKLSYIQIPAVDARASAEFYATVFGWSIQPGSVDHTSFEDKPGELAGAWVTGRRIVEEPGLIPYIYVDHIDEAIERIQEHGGSIVTPPFPEGDLWVALFKDPVGNVLGVWKMGPR